MKNHVLVSEKESQEIVEKLERQKKIRETSMVWVVSRILKEIPYPQFSYYEGGTIALRRTIYLLWDNKVYGKIFLDFKNHKYAIAFAYYDSEISYDWEPLAKDIDNARMLIRAYIEGSDAFENFIN